MKVSNILSTVGVLALAVFFSSSCSKNDSKVNEPNIPVVVAQGKTMGTFYNVQVVGEFPGGKEALTALCENEFKKIVDAISTFDENAELYKFNEFQSTNPYPISALLGKIVAEAQHQSLRLHGAMDISVGPLVNLWGFGKDKRLEKTPTQEQIDEAKNYVGLDKYEIRTTPRETLLVKRDPRVRLDLSTIGEGVGVDHVALELDKLGISNYLVSVAGASRSKGYNSKGQLWKIGIEDPTNPDKNIFDTVCPLDQAMSTAGSYRNYFKDDTTGKIYSHAIDPETGKPVDHQTMSVTVVSRSAFVTDAIDTGLLVWGADKALAWADRHDIPIYTIELVDGKAKGRYSRAFEQYLKCGKKSTK